jgi:hypothetical protein
MNERMRSIGRGEDGRGERRRKNRREQGEEEYSIRYIIV